MRTDDLVERMARFEPELTRLCISMVTHGRAYRVPATSRNDYRTGPDSGICPRRAADAHAPAPGKSRSTGVDMIGIGLDAVTEKLLGASAPTFRPVASSGGSTGRS